MRRLLLPVQLAVVVVAMVLLAVAAVIGALAAPLARRRRLLRVACFGLAYGAVELAAMVAALAVWVVGLVPGDDRRAAASRRDRRLLTWALGAVLGAARRCFGFTVVTEGRPVPTLQAGAGSGRPTLVLARHGGPGDSFALVHLLLAGSDRNVRIVLKELLRLDPLLDVLLTRLGSCFLPARADDPAVLVGATAGALGDDEVLLVFPEGGNWTPARRGRAILRLRRHGRREAARAAELMTNVLPARPAGVLACLDARPDLDVVVVAHAGLDRIVSLRRAWDALPLTSPMTVRMWPAVAPPATEEARTDWLTAEWATVDEWVDAHRGS